MPNGKPNILIIWGDDIGISNLSCYSNECNAIWSANIDRIAKEGIRFTDYYGEQSCTAGRAAFICGQKMQLHRSYQGRDAWGHSGATSGGSDDRHSAQGAWLRHRSVRQEPPRRP